MVSLKNERDVTMAKNDHTFCHAELVSHTSGGKENVIDHMTNRKTHSNSAGIRLKYFDPSCAGTTSALVACSTERTPTSMPNTIIAIRI
jgi:hypothetical protein